MGDFDLCQCNPQKCPDCTTAIAACEGLPGCLDVVACVYDRPCTFPHEDCANGQSCYDLTGETQSSTVGQAANGVIACFGGC